MSHVILVDTSLWDSTTGRPEQRAHTHMYKGAPTNSPIFSAVAGDAFELYHNLSHLIVRLACGRVAHVTKASTHHTRLADVRVHVYLGERKSCVCVLPPMALQYLHVIIVVDTQNDRHAIVQVLFADFSIEVVSRPAGVNSERV